MLRLFYLVVGVLLVYSLYVGIQVSKTWHNTFKKVEKEPVAVDIPASSADLVSVLVMGIDTQGLNFESNRGRSDANMLVLLNLKTGKILALSIPRDIRVELYPGRYEKLGHAYAYKPELAFKVVENLLLFPVDYYIAINEKTFEQFIDVIGGIEIDVEKELANEMEDVQEGEQKLSGDQALYYTRFRNDSKYEGDFGRMRRQQQVLNAARQQAFNLTTFFNAGKLLDIVSQNIQHNVPPDFLIKKGTNLFSLPSGSFHSMSLKGEIMKIDSLYYVIPDRHELIQVRKELRLELERAK